LGTIKIIIPQMNSWAMSVSWVPSVATKTPHDVNKKKPTN